MRTDKMTECLLITVVSLALLGVANAAGASEPDVDEIVRRSNLVAYYQGKDGRAEVEMTIVDSQDRERTRELIILRRDDRPDEAENEEDFEKDQYTGDQRYYVYFHRPSDWEDTVFMVWKNVEVDEKDNRWLYLPDLDLVKRIAAGDKRTSFAGSHFFYEDISGRNPAQDDHELVDTTDRYYVLESTPREDADKVEFDHYRTYVHRDTFMPIQTDYFDEEGENYRRYKVEEVEKVEGYLTVVQSRMEDLRDGGHTVLEYDDVEYDRDIPRDIFEERYLKKAPREYLGEN